MLELLRGTKAKVGAECGLCVAGAVGLRLCELAAAEGETLAGAEASSCVDRISIGTAAESMKAL